MRDPCNVLKSLAWLLDHTECLKFFLRVRVAKPELSTQHTSCDSDYTVEALYTLYLLCTFRIRVLGIQAGFSFAPPGFPSGDDCRAIRAALSSCKLRIQVDPRDSSGFLRPLGSLLSPLLKESFLFHKCLRGSSIGPAIVRSQRRDFGG